MRLLYLLSLITCFPAVDGAKAPHPVAKYWRTILIVFEVAQKRASPLGNDKQRNPNINGIIHSIIRLWACCLGSAVVGITIFCCTHIVPPTRMARSISGSARFNHRKSLPKGNIENTTGQE